MRPPASPSRPTRSLDGILTDVCFQENLDRLLAALPHLRGALPSHTPSGLPLASWVVRGGDRPSALERLRGHGLDVEAQDGSGFRALHVAAEQGHPNSVRWLLAAGADPNGGHAPTRPHGVTPLHLAARYAFSEIAADLLHAGADVHARDETGCCALVVACQAACDCSEQHGHLPQEIQESFHIAQLRTVAALLNAGARPEEGQSVVGSLPSAHPVRCLLDLQTAITAPTRRRSVTRF